MESHRHRAERCLSLAFDLGDIAKAGGKIDERQRTCHALQSSCVRAWLANAISPSMKHSFAVGIGLFLAFIGLYETGIVTSFVEGTPTETLRAVNARARELVQRHARHWEQSVKPALREAGIRIVDCAGCSAGEIENV